MRIIKNLFLNVILSLIIVSLFSCGVYNSNKENANFQELVYETTAAKTNYPSNGFTSSNSKTRVSTDFVTEESLTSSGNRKIAKSVSLNAETKTFDNSLEWLKTNVYSFNGIIDNSYIDTGDKSDSNYKKNANFAMRIPAEKLDSFIGSIGNNLNITFKQESIFDITDEYYDSDSRLKSLIIEEEKLNEMLKLAKNVDEMIKIEDKLSEVRTNIENINRKIKNYDKQVNYSKVDINIIEVKDLTDIKTNANDFSKENLNKKMLKTLDDVILFLKNVAAYIFINIPWIILGIIVIIIEILLYMFLKSIFLKKKYDENTVNVNLQVNKLKDECNNKNNDKNYQNKNKAKDINSKDSQNNKKELSDEEKFDKVLDEIGKVITDESMKNVAENSDVEVEFYNKEK